MRAVVNGTVIAESDTTVVVEGNHYFPPASVDMTYFSSSDRTTVCPWKGTASYYDVTVDGQTLENVAWYYPTPSKRFELLRDHIAFYPGPMDGCFVNGERVQAQPGDFYGGWITSDLDGPFKGGAGSMGW